MKKKLKLLVLCFFELSMNSNAQYIVGDSLDNKKIIKQTDTIAISPKVGNVIDLAEKIRYRIFPFFSSTVFINAVFIRQPDSLILLKTMLKPDSISERLISKEEFVWIKNMIEKDYLKDEYVVPIPKKIRKFYVSVFFGGSSGRAQNEIEAKMITNGFGETSPSWIFFEAIDHPVTYKSLIYDFEVAYYLTNNTGISLNIAEADNISIDGYKKGNYLFLRSDIWSISSSYIINTNNQKLNFFIGPCLIFHNMKQDIDGYYVQKKNIIPALYLGGSMHIVQTKYWFLALKLNYRWTPNLEIGPFKVGSGTNISEFERTKINISCFDFGLSTGIRLGK